ncbi:MAG TPA: NADH:flavin oxidoreductase, partial [Planctomycetia bacterium]|nr:NADH:flavin oxidoreductase [Planctomycetia bacterium]
MSYRRVASYKSQADFEARLEELGIELPLGDGSPAPLARPLERGGLKIGNRFAVLPMEGWDGTTDGKPTDLTFRRWERFGRSGCKLIWGGEAVAVRPDGRANPNQLVMLEQNVADIAKLRETLTAAHRNMMGDDKGLVVGLQLTHSGRYCKPTGKFTPEPQVLYRHPVLDARVGVAD